MGFDKLDWTKVATYQDFQRLVNHLIALELGQPGYVPGFIPSDPDIGADGGWDGQYTGTFDRKKGEWCFQAKYTKKNGAQASKYLRRSDQVPSELIKAKNNGVDFLVIATNANLTVPRIRELQQLNNGQVKELFIWAREELERRIQNQPWLRYTFFGQPQLPAFVPETRYSRSAEPLSTADVKYLAVANGLKEIRAFLQGDERALVVHGSGGTGKSRLLREVARRCKSWRTQYEPWFLRHGIRDIADAFQDELPRTGRKYLLLCDDAGRYSDETARLASFASVSGEDVKLLAVCRSGWKDHLDDMLKGKKVYDVGSVQLGTLSEKQATTLFHSICTHMSVDDTKRIVTWLSHNPFWVVTAAKALALGVSLAEGFSEEQLRAYVIDGLQREARSSLAPLDIAAGVADRLLCEIALLSPFALRSGLWQKIGPHPTVPVGNDDVTSVLGARLKITPDKVTNAIETLLSHGILRLVGRGIRFAADMTGDIILGARIDRNDGAAFLQQAHGVLRSVSIDNVLRNIVQAQCKKRNALEFCRDLIKSWVLAAPDTSPRDRARRLGLCSEIKFLAPREAIDLVYAYLGMTDRTRKKRQFLGYEAHLTDDNFGPVLSGLALQGAEPVLMARAIRDLAVARLGGTYDNYKTRSLISDLVRPSEGPASRVIPALREIMEWFQSTTVAEADVDCAKAAVEEVLAGVHEYRSSSARSLTISGKVLEDSPVIREIRDVGMKLLETMIGHGSPVTRRAGYEACLIIGKRHFHGGGPKKLPLDARIARDERLALQFVAKAVKSETDLRALSSAEATLLRWWLCEKHLAKKSGQILRSFPRTLEYNVFQIMRSPDDFVEDFEALARKVPASDRWGWWVEQLSENWKRRPEDYLPLVRTLCSKYGTPTAVVNLLRFLFEGFNPDEALSGHSFHILEAMHQINTELWSRVRFSSRLWSRVPEIFRFDIECVLVRVSTDAVDRLAALLVTKTKCKNGDDVAHFARLLRSAPDETQVEKYALLIARQAPQEVVQKASSDLFALCYGRRYLFLKLFRCLVKKDRPGRLLDAAWTFLRYPNVSNVDEKELATLRPFLSALLVQAEKTDHPWYEVAELVHQGDHKKMLAAVAARFRKYTTRIKANGYATNYRVLSPFDHNSFTRCFKTEADIRDAIILALKWSQKHSHQAETLLKIIPRKATSKDGTQVDVFADFAAQELGRGTSPAFKKAATVLSAARIEEQNEPVFMKLLEVAVKVGELNLALDTVWMASGMHGTSSRGLGQPNPRYAAARDTLRRLADRLTPGVARTRLDEIVEHTKEMIEDDLLRDEEDLEPK